MALPFLGQYGKNFVLGRAILPDFAVLPASSFATVVCYLTKLFGRDKVSRIVKSQPDHSIFGGLFV